MALFVGSSATTKDVGKLKIRSRSERRTCVPVGSGSGLSGIHSPNWFTAHLMSAQHDRHWFQRADESVAVIRPSCAREPRQARIGKAASWARCADRAGAGLLY